MKGFKVGNTKVIMSEYTTGTIIDIYRNGACKRSEVWTKESAPKRFKELFNGFLWLARH